MLAGGNRDADGATRGWAPPESLQAPHSPAHRVASSTRDHPVTDVGAQGMLAWGLSAVHVPLSPLPCAQGCTLRASTALSVSTIAGPWIACLPVERLRWAGSRLGTLWTLSSSSQSQLPSAPWLCHLPARWVLLPGGVRQVAPHGPPDFALPGLLQDGVLRSQVPQTALAARGL